MQNHQFPENPEFPEIPKLNKIFPKLNNCSYFQRSQHKIIHYRGAMKRIVTDFAHTEHPEITVHIPVVLAIWISRIICIQADLKLNNFIQFVQFGTISH